jgi:hypothetical protein
MNILNRLLFLAVLPAILLTSCGEKPPPVIQTEGPEVVAFRALAFALSDVTLLEGPFLRATELNRRSLLNYEPDRFLARFREEAGLPPRAEQYDGWEAQSIAGHSLGHYLSACALMYQTTGGEEFLNRVNYIVEELALCQAANGGGYLGAFSRGSIDDQDIGMVQAGQEGFQKGQWVFENEIARGIIVAAPFSLNGIWAPYYTLHKVLAGLRDAYRLCGNDQALEVMRGFGDWMYGILAHLPDEVIQEMLLCEYGGINETFADLYGFTGDPRHLELSRLFHDEVVLGPLERGEDRLQGLHANTQIPKLTGLARRHELTGDEADRQTAWFFWEAVTGGHTYCTGGNCNEEYFGAPGQLRDRLGPNTTETCNVYNMLRLTDHLFQWTADARLADYYERALLNHIRASQHPEDGRVIYNLNIDMGGQKHFQNPFGFTCCVGTGMENHSKYGSSIYFYNDRELFVNQFIASELNWRDKGLLIRQETAFPDEESTRLKVVSGEAAGLTLQIRIPHWATQGMQVSVNGERLRQDTRPGSYLAIERNWRSGDLVEIHFPFALRVEGMPDDPGRVALFHGPVLLAGDLGPAGDPGVTDPHYVPVMMTTDPDPANWIVQSPGLHRFMTGAGRPRDVGLVPFYEIHDRRHTVYWDLMTEEDWQEREEQILREQRLVDGLDQHATDRVVPGSASAERHRHNLQGRSTSIRTYKERTCREAERGGWFSYDMRVPESGPAYLVVEYWGGFEGSRTFDILAGENLVATVNGSSLRDGHFIKEAYLLPVSETDGRDRVGITFRPHDFNRAGPVFGLWLMGADALNDLVDFNEIK